LRTKLILEIGNLVNVLTLSEWTFQRDFDIHMQKIQQARLGLDGSYYNEFVRRLRAKVDRHAAGSNHCKHRFKVITSTWAVSRYLLRNLSAW